MKTDGTQPIGFGQLNLETGTIINQGLSKREYFAAMAMQGLVSDPNRQYVEWISSANEAMEIADALILALNK